MATSESAPSAASSALKAERWHIKMNRLRPRQIVVGALAFVLVGTTLFLIVDFGRYHSDLRWLEIIEREFPVGMPRSEVRSHLEKDAAQLNIDHWEEHHHPEGWWNGKFPYKFVFDYRWTSSPVAPILAEGMDGILKTYVSVGIGWEDRVSEVMVLK